MKPLIKSALLATMLLVILTAVTATPLVVRALAEKEIGEHIYMLKGGDDHGGTGFQVETPSGKPVIVTNSHVCENASADEKTIFVFKDDEKMVRKILKIDDASDLCVVEGWPNDPGLKVGKDVKDGQGVREIGHPGLGPLKTADGEVLGRTDVDIMHHMMPTGQKGLDKLLNVSKKPCKGPKYEIRKHDTTMLGIFQIKNVPLCFVREKNAIKVDAPTFPGNSGSPLIDKEGTVVGVIFASDSEENGYAVNVDHLNHLLKNF